MTTFLLPITMREAWHLVKRTAGLGITKIQHKALIDMTCHYDSGRTTPTDTAYTLGMHNGHVVIGLSAVVWFSIPAAASTVAPKRTNEQIVRCIAVHYPVLVWARYLICYPPLSSSSQIAKSAVQCIPVADNEMVSVHVHTMVHLHGMHSLKIACYRTQWS